MDEGTMVATKEFNGRTFGVTKHHGLRLKRTKGKNTDKYTPFSKKTLGFADSVMDEIEAWHLKYAEPHYAQAKKTQPKNQVRLGTHEYYIDPNGASDGGPQLRRISRTDPTKTKPFALQKLKKALSCV